MEDGYMMKCFFVSPGCEARVEKLLDEACISYDWDDSMNYELSLHERDLDRALEILNAAGISYDRIIDDDMTIEEEMASRGLVPHDPGCTERCVKRKVMIGGTAPVIFVTDAPGEMIKNRFRKYAGTVNGMMSERDISGQELAGVMETACRMLLADIRREHYVRLLFDSSHDPLDDRLAIGFDDYYNLKDYM